MQEFEEVLKEANLRDSLELLSVAVEEGKLDCVTYLTCCCWTGCCLIMVMGLLVLGTRRDMVRPWGRGGGRAALCIWKKSFFLE